MTITNATLAACAVMVNPQTVELELINAGLDGAGNYTASLEKEVAKVACKVLSGTLALASVKEGDLTVSYDKEGIKSRLAYLSNLHGFTEFQSQSPTVSSPKFW